MPYKCPEKAREASRKSAKKYREKNRAKVNLIALGRYHKLYKGTEKVIEANSKRSKKWREANPEKVLEYRQNEEQKEKARIRATKWQKDNPGRANANSTLRKRKVRRATPDWVCRKELGQKYEEAYQMEIKTGMKHHVDHIIPLVHPDVCGLHVPYNLQVLPALDNLKKGNKF